VKAVLFDIGGVVVASPFTAISNFEQQHNLKKVVMMDIVYCI
jgi:hypothetical protein